MSHHRVMARDIATSWLRDYSAEITPSDSKAMDAARKTLRPGTEVFITFLTNSSFDQQLAVATQIRQWGFLPVPHLVARTLRDTAELGRFLQRFADAGVQRVMLLGGDRDRPVGEFSSSLQLLETGMIGKSGIRKIALACYPEGHPHISAEELISARDAKLAMAAKDALEVTLVSQVCFESSPIIALAQQLRDEGVNAPLRVGVAGVASSMALLRFAMICGVGTSMRMLKNQTAGLGVLTRHSPEILLTELADAQAINPVLGIEGVHFFPFGSLQATARFADAY